MAPSSMLAWVTVQTPVQVVDPLRGSVVNGQVIVSPGAEAGRTPVTVGLPEPVNVSAMATPVTTVPPVFFTRKE